MARKKKAAAKENAERWLLTYADLITLLMVFFVLLFSMSHTDVQKFKALAQSLHAALNPNVLSGSQAVQLSSGGSSSSSLIEQQDFQRLNQSIKQIITITGISPQQIATQITKDGIAVTISGTLLFYNGTDQIKSDGIQLLQKLATYLQSLPNAIRVEGHTDNVPVQNAQFPTNWELSTARAVAVVRYLSDTLSIAPSRLSAVGFGQYQPIVPNDTREHQEQNRRAVIVILYPQGDANATATPAAP